MFWERRSSLLTERGLISMPLRLSFFSVVRLPDLIELDGVFASWDCLCIRVSILMSAIMDAFIRSTLI